jgi:simple sugar transport system permease protein
MSVEVLQATIAIAILATTPLLLASVGELMSGRTGVLNVGIEGMMLMGAATGFAATTITGDPNIGLLVGALAGLAQALMLAIPVVVLNIEQLLPGFAVWLTGVGLSVAIGNHYVAVPISATIGTISVPGLSTIPVIGQVLFVNPWPVYVAVVLPLIAAFVLDHTRHGMNMRSIGEDPVAADAAGVPVRLWRFVYIELGGLLAGFAGAFLAIEVVGRWEDGVTGGRGWLALAIVIFAQWRPLPLIFGSYLFGVLLALVSIGQALAWPIPSNLLAMIPYAVTVAVLIVSSAVHRRRGGGSEAPAALGTVFIRGS